MQPTIDDVIKHFYELEKKENELKKLKTDKQIEKEFRRKMRNARKLETKEKLINDKKDKKTRVIDRYRHDYYNQQFFGKPKDIANCHKCANCGIERRKIYIKRYINYKRNFTICTPCYKEIKSKYKLKLWKIN